MEKGVCVISIDYESAWGVSDKRNTPADLARIRNETKITEALLTLFEQHKIPATWAIVGKLLENRGDNDPAWTDVHGLIKRIQNSSAGHEIGSHSYAHVIYGVIDADAARADIMNAKRVHEQHGLPFRSFVFPRNREGHHDIIKQEGITAFRGKRPLWYHLLPYRLWPLGRGIDYWLPTAHTVLPTRHKSGLMNIPDSLLLVSRKGIQKLLPPSQTVRKFRWGLASATRSKKIFHLWFHPSNFSDDTEIQLKIFERMLSCAAEMRDRGEIDVLTMGQCIERYATI